MKSEKEIIDDIVSRLKSRPEVAYRQGAWEEFKGQHVVGRPTTKLRSMRSWAAAAALLVVGMGALYYINYNTLPSDAIDNNLASENTSLSQERPVTSKEQLSAPQPGVTPSGETNADRYANSIKPTALEASNAESKPTDVLLDLPLIAAAKTIDDPRITIATDNVVALDQTIRKSAEIAIHPLEFPSELAEQHTLAAAAFPNAEVRVREVENRSQNKRVHFGNKLDLGLFVSPSSTGEKMNVGGGLVLAYNLTNKISLRTGASYNSYEMGTLKNPNGPDSYESVRVNNDIQSSPLSSPSSEISTMMVPNVNAVTSIVQSVDVPLEFKYNVGKTLYAVAGVSYSAIIGQERNAHYIQNVNAETFSQGVPENEKQMQKAVKAVTKTVKSADKNVSTNGFNGFVNFSLGKKVNLNNRFGISVEPYFKIPVGEYRRADMDYTNGGIRIMTSF